MLNYEEELAKFKPVMTTDMLSQSVRRELEDKDIASFLMEIAGESGQKTDARNANRSGENGR